jgi:hypothetical protein
MCVQAQQRRTLVSAAISAGRRSKGTLPPTPPPIARSTWPPRVVVLSFWGPVEMGEEAESVAPIEKLVSSVCIGNACGCELLGACGDAEKGGWWW